MTTSPTDFSTLLLPAHVRLRRRLSWLAEGELDAELPWLATLALLQVGLFICGAWLDSGTAL